ncbi:MAG: hypothetical protein N3F03_07730 [Ignavibacteria bacterium]|nr:hypothetical protein [Ignavibacteria bacterium]
MKKIITIILIFLAQLFAQNFNGRLTSAYYTFERFESNNVSNRFLRSYQYGQFNLNKGLFSLRTSLAVEQDLIKKIKYDPRVRVFNFYVEGRDLLNVATIKVGRQPLYHSIASGLFDGVNLDLKLWKLKFQGYYGANVPAYQKFELIKDWKENYLFGGKLQAQFGKLFLGLGYLNKNFKSEDYLTTRLDQNLNPILVLVQPGSSQFEFFNAEVGYDFTKFSIDSRLFYDINFNKISRADLSGEFGLIKGLDFNIYYAYREPLIRYNSYFTIFESVVQNTHEVDFGLNYKLNNSISLLGKLGYVKYIDDNSVRFSVSTAIPLGMISYTKNFGYSGELDQISIYSNYRLLNGKLTPSIGFGYSSYKLSKTSPKNSALYLMIGTNFRPWRVLSFDVQGQYMNNKIYKNDFRLFFKINYWFNTNLNVL